MRTAETGLCRMAAMVRSDFSPEAAPNVFLMLIDIPAGPIVADTGFASLLPERGYTITFAHQAPPASRGSIRLAGNDPQLPPVIDPRYYTVESDLSDMIEYLGIARSVGETDALSPWREAEVLPGPDVIDEAELGEYLRRSSGTTFHPVGTCRIGADPLGVVDSDLRVHGVEGLRIADASIMPDIVSVNPNATVVAIAERAAERILTAA
jgi:choline dehydrogenase